MRLPLPDLEVKGFRLFEHLRIDRLGRVNLLVGRNNAGKSTVLEAVRIWANRGAPSVVTDILLVHDEFKVPNDSGAAAVTPPFDTILASYSRLFHASNGSNQQRALIGPCNSPDELLSLEVGWSDYRELSQPNQVRFPPFDPDGPPALLISRFPVLRVEFGKQHSVWYLPGNGTPYERTLDAGLRGAFPTLYVSPNGLDSSDIGRLWDTIALTEYEDHVIAALRIVAPAIERLSLVGDTARTVVAKARGSSRPVPLRSMGDGVNRILGMILSLVSARNGLLLIDEVENGVHYSVQGKLWELIFREAHRLNVQVFATTHSWDCIEAFQQAAQEDEHEEAALVRLNANEDRVSATIFSEQELSVVTRQQIEVR